ncbi:MAG: von Willebrand factor type A domain-containing protein [Opitutaceae bacterium]|nr:von Willebrand factor type A domain-containing protein [Opitutaceae bacterium]
MNHQDPLQPWISPDLEARITAWVLGEASPFEIAELTRLVSDKPELAVFKRRLELVHGLVTDAHRPPAAPLTLSPERRARVLAALEAHSPSVVPEPVIESGRSSRPWVSTWLRWTGPIAASVVLVFTLGLVLRTSWNSMPTDQSAKFERQSLLREEVLEQDRLELPRVTFSESSAPLKNEGGPELSAGFSDGLDAAKTEVLQASAGRPQPPRPAMPSAASSPRKDADLELAGRRNVMPTGLLSSATGTVTVSGSATAANPSVKVPAWGAEDDKQTLARSFGSTAPKEVRDLGGATYSYFKSAGAGDGPVRPSPVEAGEKKLKLDAFTVSAEPRQVSPAPPAAPASKRKADPSAERSTEPADERKPAKPVSRTNAVGGETPAWQQEVSAAEQSESTFSLHVSDASFRLARAALALGALPDPASVRAEEFYNAFDYGDPAPAAGEAVQAWIEQAGHPFLSQRSLVRIAVRVPASGRGANQPLSLTVLLDTSGSMEREDRAATVRQALTSLASLLGPNDTLSLVGFARQPRLLADRLSGDKAGQLVDLAARTPAEGGTDLEAALKLAGEVALRQRRDGARNRIVLLTDGAANLGEADPAALARRIRDLRQQGIAFDACGIGADGLDDRMIEALTRDGDGRYQVLNTPEEADDRFAGALAGAFRPAAENVKVQVRFNPARVGRYRLLGFEHHRLKAEDFRNDQVDAAELAAEEAAVALYQIEARPDGEGELGEVLIRFRNAADGRMVERSWTLVHAPQAPSFVRASPSLKLAGTAAFLAEKLRGGDAAAGIRLSDFAPVVNELRGHYSHEARVQELVTMFAQSRRLLGE